MIKTINKFKCDACNNGIVKMVRKETKGTIIVAVNDCNKCKKPYGFKSCGNLVEIAD